MSAAISDAGARAAPTVTDQKQNLICIDVKLVLLIKSCHWVALGFIGLELDQKTFHRMIDIGIGGYYAVWFDQSAFFCNFVEWN